MVTAVVEMVAGAMVVQEGTVGTAGVTEEAVEEMVAAMVENMAMAMVVDVVMVVSQTAPIMAVSKFQRDPHQLMAVVEKMVTVTVVYEATATVEAEVDEAMVEVEVAEAMVASQTVPLMVVLKFQPDLHRFLNRGNVALYYCILFEAK